MKHDLVVSGSIDVNANASKVWNALTNPAIIKEYLFGTETSTDWKVGSAIIFQGSYNGTTYRDHGVILENVPQQRISYSYWSGFSGLEDKPENYGVVTYILQPKNEGVTNFTWIQKGYATEEGYKHSKDGMQAFLEQIKGIMER